MTNAGRLGKFLQLGYVCRDLDKAMATFAERCGVASFNTMEGKMPQFGREPVLRIALAFRGDIQVELIQPPTDIPTVYSHALPADSATARLHHFGYLVDDMAEWERVQAHHKKLGNPRLSGEDLPMISYCYFDTYADTGHFTEYFLPGDDMKAFWASLPRYP